MSSDDRPTLRLAHSPDPDDAFMWWPLFELNDKPPRLDTGRFLYTPVTQDIESLNRRSSDGELEISAMSCAQYPRVQDRYAITACGASMGDNYGPKLVARQPMSLDELREFDGVIAIPGERTTAYTVLRLLLGGESSAMFETVDFKDVIDLVADGRFDIGLVIHEGQLTFAESGLHLVVDLGQWWMKQYGRPLPLGVNAVRRDLEAEYGVGTLEEVQATLRRSVDYALAHREESVAYAMKFARDMTTTLADEFIALYVNKWTLAFGDDGCEALRTFFDAAAMAHLLPAVPEIDLVGTAPMTP